jgi:hypothetical protein
MTYSFNYTGQTLKNVIISGTYSAAGDTITLRQRSAACSSKSRDGCRFIGCRAAGTYRFATTNGTLSFALVDDRCRARTAVLSGRFTKRPETSRARSSRTHGSRDEWCFDRRGALLTHTLAPSRASRCLDRVGLARDTPGDEAMG